jgi:hypothetical protein
VRGNQKRGRTKREKKYVNERKKERNQGGINEKADDLKYEQKKWNSRGGLISSVRFLFSVPPFSR